MIVSILPYFGMKNQPLNAPLRPGLSCPVADTPPQGNAPLRLSPACLIADTQDPAGMHSAKGENIRPL